MYDLRHDIDYVVKVFPVSGDLYGQPSVVNIPASTHLNADTQLTIIPGHTSVVHETEVKAETWTVQITGVKEDSVYLRWKQPERDVVGTLTDNASKHYGSHILNRGM